MNGIQESLQDLVNNAVRVTLVSGGISLGSVSQGSPPWDVQGVAIAGSSNVGVKPIIVGINSDGGTSRFLTAVNSAANTSGQAILAVGAMLTDGGSPQSWSRPLSTVIPGIQQTAHQFSYTNLTTSGTTTIKSGTGILHSITINSKGTGTTLTVYDNTTATGTKIGTINTTLDQNTLIYDLKFTTGLTVLSSDGAVQPDITVSWL